LALKREIAEPAQTSPGRGGVTLVKWPHIVNNVIKATRKQERRSTEVNFKHGGGRKIFRSLRSRTYPMLSHFQIDGATSESSKLFSLSNSMLLELKRGERKSVRKGQRQVLATKNVRGGSHRSIRGRAH